MRRSALAVGIVAALSGGAGCASNRYFIDPDLVVQARVAAQQDFEDDDWWSQDRPPRDREYRSEESEAGGIGEVILGELIAIFPGFFVHGLGHLYAGDRRTWRQLSRVGQTGFVFAAVGGGLGIGGHFAQEEDLDTTAITLYVTGGLLGGAGVLYLLTAWVYDIADTPRAVLEGGRPPPPSKFVNSLDFFD